MKKLCKVIMLATSTILLAGCANSVSLSERAIVKAICLDYTDLEYTAQLVVYSCAASGDVKSINEQAIVYKGKGENIDKALAACEARLNKKPFYAQNELLLISSEICSNNGKELLEYFNKQDIMGQDLAVFVTDSINDIESCKSISDIIKDAQRIASDNYELRGAKRIYEYSVLDNAISGYIPYIEINDNGCSETGILINRVRDNPIFIEKSAAKYVKLLDDRLHCIDLADENIRLDTLNISFEARMNNDIPRLTVYLGGNAHLGTQADIKLKDINNNLNNIFAQITKETFAKGNDIFRFANRMRAIDSAACDDMLDNGELYTKGCIEIISNIKAA